MNKFSKVAGYKINIQQSITFIYMNIDLSERKKTIPFTVVSKNSKKLKYLGINLTKEVKDLYTENYEILVKIIDDTIKLKDIPCLWIRGVNIIKMSILSKAKTKFKRQFSQK